MTESPAETRKNTLSRRGFLKGAASTLISVAIPPILTEHTPKNVKKEDGELVVVDTAEAVYIPMYERHDQRITLDQIRSAGQIDLHFYEITYPSRNAIAAHSLDHLYRSGLVSSPLSGLGLGNKELTENRITPDDILSYFAEKNISVSYEGSELPTDSVLISKLVTTAEPAVIAGFAANDALQTIRDLINKKELSTADLIKKSAIWGYVLWASSPLVTGRLGAAAMDKEGLGRSITQNQLRVINRFNAFIAHAHPEDLIVFFRNVIMARQLQLLGEDLSGKTKEKPRISYQVGGGHAGIEDFLLLGDKLTIATLSIYPKQFLEHVVDYNGGIDAFCSTIIIPVRQTLETGDDTKRVILDQQLKDYLEARFKESEKAIKPS